MDKSRKTKATGFKWLNPGRSIPGVPTHDLTPEEWARWGGIIQETEKNTGRKFFEPVFTEPAAEPAETEGVA